MVVIISGRNRSTLTITQHGIKNLFQSFPDCKQHVETGESVYVYWVAIGFDIYSRKRRIDIRVILTIPYSYGLINRAVTPPSKTHSRTILNMERFWGSGIDLGLDGEIVRAGDKLEF
jgi:hypothetical protein